MTHGEAWYEQKQNVDLSVDPLNIKKEKILPKPMSKKDAARYYNTKLFAYWMDKLDDRLSIYRKKQIISALMFGHTQNYKYLVENKDKKA